MRENKVCEVSLLPWFRHKNFSKRCTFKRGVRGILRKRFYHESVVLPLLILTS